MLDKNKIAVISSGNGGQAMAAYFTWRGYYTSLYAREAERVDMFPTNTFEITGQVEATVDIALISSKMSLVIEDAHLIMVTTPAQYHHVVAREMAPYLQDGQVIVLNPGRSFGTTEYKMVLSQCHVSANVILAEAETFFFTCRCYTVGNPTIYKIKDNMKIAAHDAKDTPKVVEILGRIFPNIQEATILETAFGNMGMIFHPLPILMNLIRVEAQEQVLYYKQAISPLVAGQLERLDAERVMLAERAGVQTLNVIDWLHDKYGTNGTSLYECLQKTIAYDAVYMPVDLHTRYIFEDIPTGCVPMVALGKYFGLDTPLLSSIVNWASQIYQTNFYERGRNEKKLDFDRLFGGVYN